jgi:hypothetical protein
MMAAGGSGTAKYTAGFLDFLPGGYFSLKDKFPLEKSFPLRMNTPRMPSQGERRENYAGNVPL